MDNFGFDPIAQKRWDERVDVLRDAGIPARQAVVLAELDPECELDEWIVRVRALLTV